MKAFKGVVWLLLLLLTGTFGYLTWQQENLEGIVFSDKVTLMSSFFMAVLTALYVLTTSKQIEVANQQLEEMKYDRTLREQPVLLAEDKKFWIERPRFFYTPPFDKYSFLSRYHFELMLKNCTTYPAIAVDVTARIKVKKETDTNYLSTAACRRNVIVASGCEKIRFMFTGDEVTWMFDSLREGDADLLPRVEFEILYKNVCGGCFKINECVMLVPEKNVEEEIISWHSCINATGIAERERIEYLKTIKDTREWNEKFDRIKEDFDKKLGHGRNIYIKCVDMLQDYHLAVVEAKVYEEETSNHVFGRYIHKKAPCKIKKTKE